MHKIEKTLAGGQSPDRVWIEQAFEAFDHDFPSWADGIIIPHGIYKTGRKVADDFKTSMQIIFDDLLPKWNYRAVPRKMRP